MRDSESELMKVRGWDKDKQRLWKRGKEQEK